MDDKGITRKQFLVQLISPIINLLLGAWWVYMGVDSGSKSCFIIGILFAAISIASICVVIVQRRRHPVENAEVDKELGEGLKAGGLALLLLAAGFLFAFGLAALFK